MIKPRSEIPSSPLEGRETERGDYRPLPGQLRVMIFRLRNWGAKGYDSGIFQDLLSSILSMPF